MSQVITVVTQAFVDPQIPTPNEYERVAADLMAALDAFAGIIPKLEQAETIDAKHVLRNLNVPDVFCSTAISAAEELDELGGVRQYTGPGRNRLQYIQALRPLNDKLEAVSRRVNHALRANKSAVAGDALEIYRVAKAKLKSKRSPALAAHVEAMKRDLAKLSMTRTERNARRAARFEAAVEQALQKRRLQEALVAQQQKEEEAKNA